MIFLIFLSGAFAKNCKKLDGTGYTGSESTTVNCTICQRWDTDYPHVTKDKIVKAMRDLSHNYCRNPDNDASGPWCYTIRVNI